MFCDKKISVLKLSFLIFISGCESSSRPGNPDVSKVALFVDNCSAHPHVSGFNCIELIFVPPNTISEMQPWNQGIIKLFKRIIERAWSNAYFDVSAVELHQQISNYCI